MNTEGDSTFLRDANWVVQKRNVRLRDILSNDLVDWLVILADGYITIPGRQVQVQSFDELESQQRKFDLPSLSDIRAQGLLIEGERTLPRWLIELLVECSDGAIRVRTSDTNAIEMMDINNFATVMSTDMSDDEIEATTTNDTWYLRMRNDDALIFIAASHLTAQKIIASSPATVRSVPDEFIFAS